MYRVLTLDKISSLGIDRFPNYFYEVGNAVENPDAILVRSRDMHKEAIPLAVRAVGRAGVGVNNIPLEKMSSLGIAVFNTPGANANAVKELVIGSLVIASRQIGEAWDFVRSLSGIDEDIVKLVEEGKKRFVGFELQGKVLGVVGLGVIGRAVANAADALGMKVVGFDPNVTVEGAWQLSANVHRAKNLGELLTRADFLTLHVPLDEKTRGLINAQNLEVVKKGVVILNFAREEIVDQEAVKAALDSGVVFSFISDFPNTLLRNHSRVVMLPHLGASTGEAEDNCAIMVVDQIRDFLENGNVRNSVNFPEASMPRLSKHRLVLANANVPNMIAKVSEALGQGKINIHDMVNMSRGEIAYTIVDLDNPVPEDTFRRIAGTEGVLMVRLIDPPQEE